MWSRVSELANSVLRTIWRGQSAPEDFKIPGRCFANFLYQYFLRQEDNTLYRPHSNVTREVFSRYSSQVGWKMPSAGWAILVLELPRNVGRSNFMCMFSYKHLTIESRQIREFCWFLLFFLAKRRERKNSHLWKSAGVLLILRSAGK